MLFSKKSKESLQSELGEIELKLKSLPTNAPEFLEAQDLIDTLKAENASTEQIDAALADKNLPSLVELGKTTAECLVPTWKLNYQRQKLEKQLSKFSAT